MGFKEFGNDSSSRKWQPWLSKIKCTEKFQDSKKYPVHCTRWILSSSQYTETKLCDSSSHHITDTVFPSAAWWRTFLPSVSSLMLGLTVSNQCVSQFNCTVDWWGFHSPELFYMQSNFRVHSLAIAGVSDIKLHTWWKLCPHCCNSKN